MTNQDLILDVLRTQGKTDALALRERAVDMDGAALIAAEARVPAWCADKDYTAWPVGAPVQDGGQVYALLQPHNAAHYPDARPAALPALWSIQHTQDPARAKPYVAPNGQSGMYMTGDCCTCDGRTWRSTMDNNVWPPTDYPDGWEVVALGG